MACALASHGHLYVVSSLRLASCKLKPSEGELPPTRRVSRHPHEVPSRVSTLGCPARVSRIRTTRSHLTLLPGSGSEARECSLHEECLLGESKDLSPAAVARPGLTGSLQSGRSAHHLPDKIESLSPGLDGQDGLAVSPWADSSLPSGVNLDLTSLVKPAVASLLIASLFWCPPGSETLAAPAGGRLGGSTFSNPPAKNSQFKAGQGRTNQGKTYSAPPVLKNRMGGSSLPPKAKSFRGNSSTQSRTTQPKAQSRTQGRVGGSFFPSSQAKSSQPRASASQQAKPQTRRASPDSKLSWQPPAGRTVLVPPTPPIRAAVPPQATIPRSSEPVETVRRRVIVRPRVNVQPGPSIQKRRYIMPPPNVLIIPPRPHVVVPFPFPFLGPPILLPPLIVPPPILVPPPVFPPPLLLPPVVTVPPEIIVPPQVIVPPLVITPPATPPLSPPQAVDPPQSVVPPSVVVPPPADFEPPPPMAVQPPPPVIVQPPPPVVVQPPPPVIIQPPPPVIVQPPPPVIVQPPPSVMLQPAPSVVVQPSVIVQQGGDDTLIKVEIALEIMLLSVLLLLLVRTFTGSKRPF